MLSLALFGNSCTAIATVAFTATRPSKRFTIQAFLNKPPPPFPNSTNHPSVLLDSLRVLEWDKVCDSVASFAGTSLGQDATKAQLWSLGQSYTESSRLLEETNAAVEMHKYGGCTMDFAGIDVVSVKSAVQHVRRGLPMDGNEAMALVALLQFAESLQLNLKATIKEDADWLQHFMPLSEMIMELVINRSLVKFIQQLIDEDGSVRDSALFQLMESLVRNEMTETSSLEVSHVDGRWCVKSGADQQTSFEGAGSIVEPLSAVPLNDELQQARASINARATYSLSFGGTCPDLFLPEDKDSCLTAEALSGNKSHPTLRKWTLYLPKANHPLLLQKHRQNLQKVVKDVTNATAENRRKRQQGGNMIRREETDTSLSTLKMQSSRYNRPQYWRKNHLLKDIGLAAMMAKSGLYILSAEPVRIPWFDSVFADIGDEQSLSQSLSTFSGHLKQTSDIQSHSTSRSLVLLDEVGAGTNPLEGAALGMSLLESFAESGALLTIATTHHGELKTLKYSHDAFENACMEFDEVNLKPTYRILWGVPGRSNALNIAERLGLPDIVISKARELYGPASAEINEVIVDMERFKQNFHEHIHEAQDYLKLSRDLHTILLVTRRKVTEHGSNERYRKMQEIFEVAAVARSTLHKKMRQLRANVTQTSRRTTEVNHQDMPALSSQQTTVDKREIPVATKTANTFDNNRQSPSEKRTKLPKVGEMVHISSLNKKATVLKVEPSKEKVVVQAGNMKLKLKLVDLVT
ncbi:hypothetical protein RJ639_001085 [Escallonia herrerae]|uniref:DNA mismatch repair proteins mutS family domain-containing protein n=1 Tax=Escallonia herrerae TaxID=1293975 RepID=A0AA89BN59_9ASTE|nr:hypothetical protein RJ639_001085 [Escallonia herrerae]